MKNRLKLILLSLAFSTKGFAQDFSNYYNYLLNPVNINSALVGAENKLEMSLNSRYMLTGIDESPRNIAFTVNSAIKGSHGVGARIISDSRGVFNTTRVDAMYAQGFDLNKEMNLRFGLSVGILKRDINTSTFDATSSVFDVSDPTINSNNFNNLKFVAGLGALYTYKNFELGLSSPQLIENASSISEHIASSLGYRYKIENTTWTLQPVVYYQNYKNSPNLLDALLKANWNNRVNLMAGYSNNNRIKGGLGINLKTLGFSYLYEHATGDLKTLSLSTHEVMLSLSILPKKTNALVTENELDKLLGYIANVLQDDQQYTKESLKKEIEKIQKQLDEIVKNNSDKNSEEVAKKLELIEGQIDALISKYNTK
jgi:type IX secretion system PorP/SprF family membrane protein